MAAPGEPLRATGPQRRVTPSVTALHSHAQARRLSDAAASALVAEVELAPKPGLVTPTSRGAHTDMDIGTFRASIEAIRPWLPVFHETGRAAAECAAPEFLARLRQPGIACERDMFVATGGVNTHKGAVFAFGLLLGCAGRLSATGERPTVTAVSDLAARMAAPLVPAELGTVRTARTYGERAFVAHGLTGARGEAASGYRSVIEHSLPAYRQTLARCGDERHALLDALLVLMARSQDTTLVKRGALDGLALVRRRAEEILDAGGASAAGGIDRLHALDRELTGLRLSPGGCADLLAVTRWFARLD